MSSDEARANTFEQEQQPSNKSGKVNFRTWVIFFISIFTLSAACFYSYMEVHNSSKAHLVLSSAKAAKEGADMIALELGDKSSITASIFSKMKKEVTDKFPKAEEIANLIGAENISEDGKFYTCTGGANWKAFLADKTSKDKFEKAFNKRFVTRGEEKEEPNSAPQPPPKSKD